MTAWRFDTQSSLNQDRAAAAVVTPQSGVRFTEGILAKMTLIAVKNRQIGVICDLRSIVLILFERYWTIYLIFCENYLQSR